MTAALRELELLSADPDFLRDQSGEAQFDRICKRAEAAAREIVFTPARSPADLAPKLRALRLWYLADLWSPHVDDAAAGAARAVFAELEDRLPGPGHELEGRFEEPRRRLLRRGTAITPGALEERSPPSRMALRPGSVRVLTARDHESAMPTVAPQRGGSYTRVSRHPAFALPACILAELAPARSRDGLPSDERRLERRLPAVGAPDRRTRTMILVRRRRG